MSQPWARYYTVGVVVLGFSALGPVVLARPNVAVPELGLLCVFSTVAEVFPVGVSGSWVTMTPAVVLPAYLLYGPFGVCLCLVLSQVVAALVLRRPLVTTLFNIAQYVLAAVTASACIARVTGLPFGVGPGVQRVPALLFVPVFMLVNHGLVDVYASLQMRMRLREVWWEPFKVEGLWAVVAIPLGVLMALAARDFGPFGAVLLFLPIFAAALTMRMWAHNNRRQQELASLLSLSQRLGRTLDWAAIVAAAETAAAQFLRGAVEVRVGRREGESAHRLVPVDADTLTRLLAGRRSATVTEGGPVELPPPYRTLLVAAIDGPGDRFGHVLALLRNPEPDPADLQYVEAVAGQLALALESVLLHKETERLAITDAIVPELFNYRHLLECLRQEVEGAAKEGRPLSLIYFDLDSFKSINDRFGHLAGDEALRLVARRILRSVRASDLVFRYAGDEFVVLLPGTDQEEAEEVARRIVTAVEEEPVISQEGGVHAGISHGVATYVAGESWQDFLRRADQSMYARKVVRKSG